MEDRLIIDQLKHGDEKAFKYVFDNHYTLLCRFANQLLHDPQLAEEIVDDAIFYLWEHRDELTITHSLRAYLVQSVRNRSLNMLNSAMYRYEQHSSNITPEENIEFLDTLFVDDCHPMGMLIEKELESEIMACIDQLPDECRRVFKMSRFQEMKQEEIARELHISVNTVKYHIKNALAYLRVHLASYLASALITFLTKLF